MKYYVLHVVYFQSQYNDTKKVQHEFVYVFWKNTHPNSDFYGITDTVCSDLFEIPAACCFLPVQGISSLAAHAVMTVHFGSIKETVFVTDPV